MSTRCQIISEGSSVYVYKHSDGYPNSEFGVLAFIVPFTNDFFKHRGHNPDYFQAQLLRHWAVQDCKNNVSLGGLPLPCEYDQRGNHFIGFGVDTVLHCDLAFLYVIKTNGSIQIRQPKGDYHLAPSVKNTRLIKTIKLHSEII